MVWVLNEKKGLEINVVIIYYDLLLGNCFCFDFQKYFYVDRVYKEKRVRGKYFGQIVNKIYLNVGKDKFVG